MLCIEVPQGYAPAASAGYVPPVAASGSGHPPYENFNNSAIDPALDPAMQGGQPPYNGAQALNPALRGVGSASPYSSAAPEALPVKGEQSAHPLRTRVPVL